MRDSITGDALFAQIVMQRQVDRRLFMMVEGEDEFSILTGHIDDANIFVLFGGSKSAVLRAAQLLDDGRVDYAMGLIDRDFDDLTGASSVYPAHIFVTQAYDLAADVLVAETGLMRRAAVAHGGTTSVATIEATTGKTFLDVVFNTALATARLRLANADGTFGLNFRDFPFHDIIDNRFAPRGPEAILQRTNSRSPVDIDFAEIAPLLGNVDARLASNPSHCGSHDLFGTAAALLRTSGATKVGAAQLAASVYTAVTCGIIRALPIHAPIEAWAASFSLRAFAC